MKKEYNKYIINGRAIIPEGVTEIDEAAFRDNAELIHVVIPSSVTKICHSAFKNCTNLKSVAIPNSVSMIGSYAFYACAKLTSIRIPSSVKRIGKSAFEFCTNLSIVDIPKGIKKIEQSTFKFCRDLLSIEIPNSVTEIGDSAFAFSGLTSIKIPNGVFKIGDNAFNCINLTTIDIPNGVYRIGSEVFCPYVLHNDFIIKQSGKIDKLRVRIKDPSTARYILYNSGLDNPAVTLYVPSGALSAYRNNAFFRRFKEILPVTKWQLEQTDNTETQRIIEETHPDFRLKDKNTHYSPSDTQKMRYVFFDTETTGVPKDYEAPSSAINNWPRLVQLSWITTDSYGRVIKENDHIIYPNDFKIPLESTSVHGISTEVARKNGEPIKDVLESFMNDVKKAKFIIGHNITFDMHVVGAELIRLKKTDTIASKPNICTMQTSIDLCAIPGKYGYKYPKLQELHKKLFGYEFEDAHNSMSDVRATLRCYLELKRRGVIKK